MNSFNGMIALEQRIMFDGAVAGDVADAVSENDSHDAVVSQETDRNEVVIVDSSIADYQSLVDGVNPNAQVMVLGQNATLVDVANALSGQTNLDAIHLISHGAEGTLKLGGETLNQTALESQAALLAEIGATLNVDGDIMLYGCSVGANGAGVDFINKLSELTDADVAASDDTTGSGGDWDLEVSTGSVVQNEELVAGLSDYDGTLGATFGSLTELPAIAQVNESHVIDVDGDGDLDIVSSDYNYTAGDVVWMENDGSENFTRHVIDNAVRRSAATAAVDIDGDGDIDVLATDAVNNALYLYTNDGSENFTKTTVDTGRTGMWDIDTADIDKDGDIDIVSADAWSNTVSVYLNDGAESFTRTSAATPTGPRAVELVDVNEDGELDLVVAADSGSVYWYQNDGAENFTEHEISNAEANAYDTKTIDVDGDGDLDVVSASDTIAWFENDGSENFTRHAITTTQGEADDVDAADIDGDGDIDFVFAHNTEGAVSWYENDGSESFTQHDLVDGVLTYASHSSVEISDLDEDGKKDIIIGSSANYTNALRWIKQQNNSDPAISVAGTNLAYAENASAVQIDAAATLSDADGDADWDGGTLTVQITANNEAADEISIPDNVVGTINTDGTNLRNGTTVIGTLSASEGTVTNGTTLTITFNDQATNALVQQTLQALSYRNTSDNPGTSNRTITITATDKNSGSANDTRTVAVSAANDAPVLDATQSPALSNITPGDTDSAGDTVGDIVVNSSITDGDGSAVEAVAVTAVDNTNGSWEYSTDGGTNWTAFSGTTGSSVDLSTASRLLDTANKIRFVPNADYSGSATITFRAWDKSAGAAGDTVDTSTNGTTTPYSTVTDTASISVSNARSATVNGDVFLGGKYIEVGINNDGAFGTTEAKPAGFYGTTGNPGVGMGSDSDGYGIGDDNRIDFFLPGAPEERWVVGYKETDGTTHSGANSGLNGDNDIAGYAVTDTSSGDTLSATGTGTFNAALKVDTEISFGVDDKGYTVTVTLTNTTGADMNSVRYMRSFDPDNTRFYPGGGGASHTDNTITSSMAEGDARSTVVALSKAGDAYNTGTGERAGIMFTTTDPNARVSINPSGYTAPNIYSDAYTYDAPQAKGFSTGGDNAIIVTYQAATLAAGDSVTFTYSTSLDNAAVLASSAASTPATVETPDYVPPSTPKPVVAPPVVAAPTPLPQDPAYDAPAEVGDGSSGQGIQTVINAADGDAASLGADGIRTVINAADGAGDSLGSDGIRTIIRAADGAAATGLGAVAAADAGAAFGGPSLGAAAFGDAGFGDADAEADLGDGFDGGNVFAPSPTEGPQASLEPASLQPAGRESLTEKMARMGGVGLQGRVSALQRHAALLKRA